MDRVKGLIDTTGHIESLCFAVYRTSWDKSLPYAKFSYNNSYKQSLKMAPFEALYGRKCRTPLFWNQNGETQVFGTDVLRHAEQQVWTTRDNLRVAQSRRNSYADTRRRELAFEEGDYVYLKVSPMRSEQIQHERKASSKVCWTV